MEDLARPHQFAFERAGFALVRSSTLGSGNALLLLTGYLSIPDEYYLPDEDVGCRIGMDAITLGSNAALRGRLKAEGVLHVHAHGHFGKPGLSRTDAADIPQIVRTFRNIGRDATHGILLLSKDSAASFVWTPGSEYSVAVDKIAIIDSPLMMAVA